MRKLKCRRIPRHSFQNMRCCFRYVPCASWCKAEMSPTIRSSLHSTATGFLGYERRLLTLGGAETAGEPMEQEVGCPRTGMAEFRGLLELSSSLPSCVYRPRPGAALTEGGNTAITASYSGKVL